MAVNLSPIGVDAPFMDGNGDPLSGGKLYTYVAGSDTAANTYTTAAGNVANANPIVLNTNGYPASGGNIVEIWLTAGVTYKFILKTSADVTVWTRDDIDGINDTSVTIDQWVTGPTPTYIGATSFSLVGDQTAEFQIGRRLKTTNTAGTIYSTITASAYASVTTVTVVNDSGTLDSGLSAVSYGLLSPTNPSTPLLADTYPIVSGSADKTKKLRIEVDGLTTATTRVLTPPDADLTLPNAATLGTIPMVSATGVLAMRAALGKGIYGLNYANNGSDATNDIDIATGGAMDATGAWWMTLASALTKQSDVGWAVGTNAGWLDTGAVGNSDYYIWLIARSDTGVVDSLCSLSSTAPTMPANYDYKRLIGWFKRVGGTIVAFHTYETDGGGIEMLWDSPTLDVNLANTLTTSRRTDAVKVPLNFSTIAILNVVLNDAGGNVAVYICCPDMTDVAPSTTAAPLFNGPRNPSSGVAGDSMMRVRTSAAGLIAARADIATVDLYAVATVGFQWGRRN